MENGGWSLRNGDNINNPNILFALISYFIGQSTSKLLLFYFVDSVVPVVSCRDPCSGPRCSQLPSPPPCPRTRRCSPI